MKIYAYISFLLIITYSNIHAQLDANSLMALPTATTTEMNAISNPKVGSLVFNIDDEQTYRYTGVTNGWLANLTGPSVYTGSFIILGEGVVTVTGIPFEPSQVTFVANANVESLDSDSNNDAGVNDRGIANSFGNMNGFARNINGNLVQQVIFGGGHGNSINDISRYSSSSNCIGIRYGNQNGNSLGKIEASFNVFNTDGFSINVNYTDGLVTVNNANPILDVQPEDVNNEAILVLYTAYK